MFAHWTNLECLLGQSLLRLSPGFDFKELCDREKMLPNWRARFCTPALKIVPCQEWINRQADEVILYVGLRADEEGREGGIYENCEIRFPLREWSWGIDEVITYLVERGISIPDRTDCARCFFQTLGQWWRLWKDHPDIYQDAVDQEKRAGYTFRSDGRDTWPASLEMLRARFERGDIPRSTTVNDDLFGFSANQCRTCSL